MLNCAFLIPYCFFFVKSSSLILGDLFFIIFDSLSNQIFNSMYRFIVMLSLLFVCSFSMASTEDLKFDNQMELLIDLNCSDTIAINSNINLQSIVPLISDEHIVIGEYLIDNFELSNIERYIGKELTSHKMPMKAMCRSSD